MVFLSDLLHISLASEEIRWMNSVQQLTTSSLASLATRTFGRVSLIILLMAALGIVRSSSFPEEAIAASIWRLIQKINQQRPLWAHKLNTASKLSNWRRSVPLSTAADFSFKWANWLACSTKREVLLPAQTKSLLQWLNGIKRTNPRSSHANH